jgi:hypothetical protein
MPEPRFRIVVREGLGRPPALISYAMPLWEAYFVSIGYARVGQVALIEPDSRALRRAFAAGGQKSEIIVSDPTDPHNLIAKPAVVLSPDKPAIEEK